MLHEQRGDELVIQFKHPAELQQEGPSKKGDDESLL
jgi:hypothetical protein